MCRHRRGDVDHSAFLTAWVGGLIAPESPSGPRARTLWGYASNGPGVYQGDTHFYSVDFPRTSAQLGPAGCPLYVFSGQEFGLDPAVLLEVVNGSSGRSGSTESKWPNHILPGTFGAGFSIGLMVKDLHIALDLADGTSVPHRHAASTVELWDAALAALGPGADHTEIARRLRGDTDREEPS